MSTRRIRTPKAEARANSQRERILDAAQKCFAERGFHGASMAEVAETADMSAGLIYRYFENKNAIVLAIIARELDQKRARIAQLHASSDFLARILESVRQWQVRDPGAMNVPLFLEMSAEAMREPEIATAVLSSDALTRGDFEAWLCRPRKEGGLGRSMADGRALAILMQCLIEGLVVRSARDPGLDAKALGKALAPFFSSLGLPTRPPRRAAARAARS